MHRSRTAVMAALLPLLAACGLVNSVTARVAVAGPQTLDEYLVAFQTGPDTEARSNVFYAFRDAIRMGRIDVTDGETAERVATVLAGILAETDDEQSRDRGLRRCIVEFFVAHPHPAAADVLLLRGGRGAWPALVSLRDPRVLPLLLDDLEEARGGHAITIRLLAELGDPGAIEPLRRVTGGDSQAAKRAVRDLELQADHGIFSPFDLTNDALAALLEQGFVFSPEFENEMYEFYFGPYPFVTADVVLHTFTLLARSALDELERRILGPRLAEFTAGMVDACLTQADELHTEELNGLARQNAAFFAVPSVLAETDQDQSARLLRRLPARQRQSVLEEVERIQKAAEVAQSALLDDYLEDYRKYQPRGRHSLRPDLAGYYRAALYLGRMTFRIRKSHELQQALLITDILMTDEALRRRWEEIDAILNMIGGERDDLATPELQRTVADLVPPTPNGSRSRCLRIAGQPELLEALEVRLDTLDRPRINTAYVPWPQSSQWAELTFGFRVFGQRYTREAHLFQQVMDSCQQGRMDGWPPSGLQLAATLFGSSRAESLLGRQQADALARVLEIPIPAPDPYRSLASGCTHVARSLFELPESVPTFMKDERWEERTINTALGHWAEVRHDIHLYAKDANMYACESVMTDRFHGYVEPVPAVYARLDTLLNRYTGVLDSSGLLDSLEAERSRKVGDARKRLAAIDAVPPKEWDWRERNELNQIVRESRLRADRGAFAEFSEILHRLRAIAEGELAGTPQSVSDGVFLKSLGARFKILALNLSNSDHAIESMAVISDQATEYARSECLQVGVGRPCAIYVAVPAGDRTIVCRGAAYTYFEFVRPLDERLDDPEWKAITTEPGQGGFRPLIVGRLGLDEPAVPVPAWKLVR